MLLSMTGFGESRYQSDELTVAIELRAVNNRYLKVILRANDPYHILESEFEKAVRRVIRRGTIQVHLRCERQYAPQDFQINAVALESFYNQANRLAGQLGMGNLDASFLGHLLAIPGVVAEPGAAAHPVEEEWPVLNTVLVDALSKLQAMRQEEGKAMAHELMQHRDLIAGQLDEIRQKLPTVAEAYRDRLHERVRKILGEFDVEIDKGDLIKEVSIFAERSDIAEEVVRLASHLDQFQEIIKEPESPGRKLEFLTQEMFREANTIGSKAGDVEISRRVVEIKGTLEKIRELVLNVE